MKLRKALDKVNKEHPERQKIQTESPEIQGSESNLDKYGWVSPVYTKSEFAELDHDRLADNRCVCMFSDALELEYFKILRTQILQRTKEKGWKTIMITSASPGEGKSIISINLAITFAKEFNQTVLLVDADLKRQKIHNYLGLQNKKSLVNYLSDEVPLDDIILWPGIEKMTLISGENTISDSAELLGSPKMKELVSEMKERYTDRYILFDTPPVLGGADAIIFAPLVDCILMVIEEGRTSIQNVKKALELIPNEKFIGFVLNKHKGSTKNKGDDVYGLY